MTMELLDKDIPEWLKITNCSARRETTQEGIDEAVKFRKRERERERRYERD